MKNIAILIPSLSGGGAERIAGILSRTLSDRYNVYLFLLKKEETIYPHGGEIVYLEGDNLFFEYSLKKNKEKFCIDCAISFMEPMNFANVRTKGKERVILSERTTQSQINPRHLVEDASVLRYYNHADCLVACSYGVKQDLIDRYGLNIPTKVIYNFVNKEEIRDKSKEKIANEVEDFLDDHDFYLSIGRLHEEKNPERLIRQFSFFHEQDQTGRKLLLIGSGELKERLHEMISEYRLEQFVKVLPYMRNPFPYLAQAKALILCSNYEGLPNVIIEAMTMGCPVIASDCLSGPRELLSDRIDYSNRCSSMERCERGILVSNDKSENTGETRFLADAMRYYADHPEYSRLVSKNQITYMEDYTNDRLMKEWISAIEDVSVCNEREDIIEEERRWISGFDNKVIFGTGSAARKLHRALLDKWSINAFLSDHVIKERYIDGIPVFCIDDYHVSKNNTVVLLATGGRGQNAAAEQLIRVGLNNIIFPFVKTESERTVFPKIVQRVREEYDGNVVVVGAGTYGIDLIRALKKNSISVLCVFDADSTRYGEVVEGVAISSVQRRKENCLYLISLYDSDNKEAWEKRLMENGIAQRDILCYHLIY